MEAIIIKDKDKIIQLFKSMQDEKDLLVLINYVGKCLYGQKTKLIKLKQLTYLANYNLHQKSRYQKFSIPKKNGTSREIYAPNKTLKYIQRCLNVALNFVFTPHPAAKGFVLNKSIKHNAILHVGSIYVYNLDLKDFFTSIDKSRIWACLKNPPFLFCDEKERVADFIAGLCCEKLSVKRLNTDNEWEDVEKFVLPQGAPTSPTLSNVVTQRLDFLLTGLAKRFGLKYSRYADDITFSSMHNVYQKDSEFITELHRIITNQNFQINKDKTRLQVNGNYRQEVTGVIVNEKLNVRSSFIKDLRKWLYLWERYGFDKANTLYLSKKSADIRLKNKGTHLENVIDGKLNYLKMIVGSDDSKYKGLNKRFQSLLNKHKKVVTIVPEIKKVNNKKEEIDLSRHKPSEVTKLLRKFRTADIENEGLKYLLHDLDSRDGLDFDKLIKTANKELKDNSQNFYIPKELYTRIDTFINGTKPHWTSFRTNYPFYWNSDIVRNWCKDNPFSHPMISNDFRDILIAFRKTIRIQNNLKDILYKIAKEKLDTDFVKFEFEWIGLDNVDILLDVEKFMKGVGGIFNTIRDNMSGSKKIKIEYIGQRTNKLKITHIESSSSKSLEEIDIKKGSFQGIYKSFFQICDWSVIAKNTNEDFNKINFLSEKLPGKEKINEENISGFTHELKFY
jgi:RNA-directed DNA polymerase